MNGLRPEARPVEYTKLDTSQQNAFGQIVDLLAEAIRLLPKGQPRRQPAIGPADWLSADRSARAVFLSGARGTEKTTVLASVILATTSDEGLTGSAVSPKALVRMVEDLRQRLV